MPALPTTCIIGAGSSGIAAAKALKDAGLPFDCFEKGDRVGGNWVFGNSNGMSSSYSTLHINTSRERMEYSDFPMPKSYPDFPRHDHIAAYFDDYVDHFGLRDHITFETAVEHASREDDGSWRIELDTGEIRRYDALIVANGHHWDPRWPEPAFPGEFSGEQMHSHDYKEPGQLAGRRVLVLGMGNSAMDIAVDASYHAERTILAARRGAHVIPKYVLGRPFDQLGASERMPFWLRGRIFRAIMRFAVGRMETYGLPEPDHEIGEAHPTMSGRILDRLAHGAIDVKPNIAELRGNRVRFEDGSEEQVDLIVYCTGYKITFPFFDEDLLSARDNEIGLYKRVFHPEIDNVFFVGLLQPLGAIMPIAERQGIAIARHLRGSYALPSRRDMTAEIRRDRARMAKRYVASKRHTIQVDFDDYMLELQRELGKGESRARKTREVRPEREPQPLAAAA